MLNQTNPLSPTPSQEEMLSRYQRAQYLMQGIGKKTIAFNSAIFPIWIDDSDCFWYTRESRDVKEYRLVNANNNANSMAFDQHVLATALAGAAGEEVDAANLPITDLKIKLNSEKNSVATLSFTAFEKRWSYDPKVGSCNNERLFDKNWSLSPDGKTAAFVKDYNLWLHDIETGEERALTKDGEECYIYGVAASGWGYTMGAKVQACWSPDSKRIFTIQRDTRGVKELPVMHHVPSDGAFRPTVKNYKISYPGDEHVETLRLVVIDIESGYLQPAHYHQIPITRNSHGFFSSNLGWWSIDNRRAYFVHMERDYKTVRIVEFDTHTGSTKVLFEETADTHIDLMLNSDEHPTFEPLLGTNELLWFSERTGWAHLYLYDLDTGELKNVVTQGSWVVRHIASVDTQRREAFIQASGRYPDRDPYYRDLCRVDLDTGELTEIASSDHEIITVVQKDMRTNLARVFAGYDDIADASGISPSGRFAVITRSRADEVPVSVLVDRDGQECCDLEVTDTSGLPENWQWPEPVKLLAADGKTDIYGLVFRPSDFCPDQSYPVVSHVFNTPELAWVSKGSFINNTFVDWPYFDAAALAELGFIVVQIDGRGTSYRDKTFHDEGYGCTESASKLEDHIAGIQQLAKRHPYMDLTRVGITTHPTGGPGGAQGLLQYPDFYSVGVANAFHDSRLQSSVMMGDKYEGLSAPKEGHLYPELMVDSLQGKLLLINGMLNTTCPPAGIFRLVDALQEANKDFDLLLLPNLGHVHSDYVVRRSWDYLVNHLLGATPPKEFKLTSRS